MMAPAEGGGGRSQRSAPRRRTPLTTEELTQGFLLHEEQLALIQHQILHRLQASRVQPARQVPAQNGQSLEVRA